MKPYTCTFLLQAEFGVQEIRSYKCATEELKLKLAGLYFIPENIFSG